MYIICMCVCMYVYACMTHRCRYVFVLVGAWKGVHVRVYVYVCSCVYECMCEYILDLLMCVYIRPDYKVNMLNSFGCKLRYVAANPTPSVTDDKWPRGGVATVSRYPPLHRLRAAAFD